MKFKIIILFLLFISAANAQIKFGVELKGGASFPLKDFKDSYNTGFGGEVGFIYAPNSSFEVALVGGYSHYNADEENLKQELLKDLNLPEELVEVDAEAPLNIYPLLISIRYLYGNKKFKPFILMEGGIFFYDLTLSGKMIILNQNIDIPEQVEKDQSTMLSLGAGFFTRLSKKIFLNVTGKWSIMTNIRLVELDTSHELSGSQKTVQTISLLAGLNYYFTL